MDQTTLKFCCDMAELSERIYVKGSSSGEFAIDFDNGVNRVAVKNYSDTIDVVVFRGTEIEIVEDDLQDLDCELVSSATVTGMQAKVHKGFNDALWAVEHALSYYEPAPEKQLWFTGHSLGASMAAIYASRKLRVKGCVTFGMPLTGDMFWSNSINKQLGDNFITFVNRRDVVSHVPPIGFARAGVMHWIDDNGQLQNKIGDVIDMSIHDHMIANYKASLLALAHG